MSDWKAELRRRIEIIREKKEAEREIRQRVTGSAAAVATAPAPAPDPIAEEEPSAEPPEHAIPEETSGENKAPVEDGVHIRLLPAEDSREVKSERRAPSKKAEPVQEDANFTAPVQSDREPTLFPLQHVEAEQDTVSHVAAVEGREQLEEKTAAPSASDLEVALDTYTPLENNHAVEEADIPPPKSEPADAKGEQPQIPHALNTRRLIAAAVDATLLAGFEALLLVIAGALLEHGPMQLLLDSFVPLGLMFVCLHFLYFTIFNAMTGQTPGKILLGLRVCRKKGSTGIGLWWAFLRWVSMIFSLAPLAVGYLWIYSRPYGAAWHDIILKMRVQRT